MYQTAEKSKLVAKAALSNLSTTKAMIIEARERYETPKFKTQTSSCQINSELNFGANLRIIREGCGLSMRDIEKRSGGKIRYSYLIQLENGKLKEPSVKRLWEIAYSYNVDFMMLANLLKPEVV